MYVHRNELLIAYEKTWPEGESHSRRRDCHVDDGTPCLSMLKYLTKVQGGCHQMTVSPTAASRAPTSFFCLFAFERYQCFENANAHLEASEGGGSWLPLVEELLLMLRG